MATGDRLDYLNSTLLNLNAASLENSFKILHEAAIDMQVQISGASWTNIQTRIPKNWGYIYRENNAS